MIARHLSSWIAVPAALMICASSARAGQVPLLTVTARVILADGGGSASNASPHPMAPSEAVTTYAFAGRTLCGVGGAEATAENLDDLLRQRGYVWSVTRTGVAHADGRLTFDLEWLRYDAGNPVPAAGGKHRLTLAEGATYPIDMVRPTSAGTCNAAAVMIEIGAGTIEAPALADTVLQYDLWLTHRKGGGQTQNRHFVVSAKQGAAQSFEFSPFRFDVPHLTPNQYDLDVVTRVIGAIKGRLRDNDRVDVELETRRLDRIERQEDTMPAVPRAGGRKSLQLKLGETVEVELPNGSGFAARAATPQSPGVSGSVGAAPRTTAASPSEPAVALKDGSIVVNFREFFSDDRFSVSIRVRRE